MRKKRDQAERERIVALVAERLGVATEQAAQLLPDIDGMDSLDIEELVLELEEEFGDDFPRPRDAG